MWISSIFLEDESIKVIGKSSTLSPEPSLLAIGEPIIIENKGFLPLEKIRYLTYSGVGLQEVEVAIVEDLIMENRVKYF